MAFHHLSDFFQMGGYYLYVWLAFTIVFTLLIGNAALMRFQLKRILRKQRQRLKSFTDEKST